VEKDKQDRIFQSVAKHIRELDPMGLLKDIKEKPDDLPPYYPLPYVNDITEISDRIEEGECHNPIEIQTIMLIVFGYNYTLSRALPISKYGKISLSIFEDIKDLIKGLK